MKNKSEAPFFLTKKIFCIPSHLLFRRRNYIALIFIILILILVLIIFIICKSKLENQWRALNLGGGRRRRRRRRDSRFFPHFLRCNTTIPNVQ